MAKRSTKSRLAAWEVSDAFWRRVEPLIPERQRGSAKDYVRKPGGGRKPKDARLVFEAIVYVLRTGCQWKALPTERFGSASAIHKRHLEWRKAGVFEALWKAGLAEYDDFEGIAWRWQSIDGAMMQSAPGGGSWRLRIAGSIAFGSYLYDMRSSNAASLDSTILQRRSSCSGKSIWQ